MLWAVAHRNQYDIKVLNLSIGGNVAAPVDYDPIAMAVEFAWKHGITVVCAAGNEGEFGPGGVTSPGNSPYVITVGASDTRQTASTSDDIMTYYSSVGPTLFDEYAKPDVVAPGNQRDLDQRARLVHRRELLVQPDPGVLLRTHCPGRHRDRST